MSTHATASFVRRELATAIRKGPYSVNMLIAGYDLPGAGEVAAGVDPAAGTTGLYWIDYLGNMRKLAYGAHGYCGYFIMSTFDRYYRKGLSVDDAVLLCKKAIAEIRMRFMVDAGNYILKVVDKDGVRELDMGDDHVLDTGAEYYARAAGGADAMDTAA